MRHRRIARAVKLLIITTLAGLTACASTPQSATLLRPGSDVVLNPAVTLNEVPFFPQEKFQCGPAALATVLQSSGVDAMPDQLTPLVYLPARKGALQMEILATGRTFGRLTYQLQPELRSILREVEQHRPVLVLQNLGLSWYPRWHYAVVVGYDLDEQRLLLRSGRIRDYSMPIRVFERTWQRGGHWAMIVLAPGEMPAAPVETAYFSSIAAFEQVNPDHDTEPAYRSGLEHWPNSKLLMMGLGNLWYRRDRMREAAAQFEKIVALYPDYEPAKNNLAEVLAESGELR